MRLHVLALVAVGCQVAIPTAGDCQMLSQRLVVEEELGDSGPEDAGPLLRTDDADHVCQNLECHVVNCGNGSQTTVSGTVFDPSGLVPLYNALVYVPNAQLDPFPPPGGDICGPPVSGSPLRGMTLTDTKGHFQVFDVPVGKNMPIVIQVGRWRREITLSHVDACVDTPVAAALTRLPRRPKETSPFDDIPKIAVVTGCDAIECFLTERIGVDPGAIHAYRGNDHGQGLPSGTPGASVLLSDPAAMKKYDAIFLASDCDGPHPRGSDAEANLEAYLAHGGTVLATHSQYNWFASPIQCGIDAMTEACIGDSDLSGTAAWQSAAGLGGPLSISADFPKGAALASWYSAVTALPSFAAYQAPPHQMPLVGLNADVGMTVNWRAVRWVFAGDTTSYDTHLLTIGAPVQLPPDKQPGRVVFASEETVGVLDSSAQAWPASCSGRFVASDHTPNELMMEFALIDQRLCVQDD